jgi:short/branched chain acyl-CoA dehydrogenase
VVNGAKAFITNSGTDITSVVTVTARTGEGADGRPEISAIMIPSGTPGFTVEAPYDKLGWHISDTHGLTFDNCRVPRRTSSASAGHGFKQFLKTLDDGRIAISALALGMIRRMREESVAYAQDPHRLRQADRHQPGGRLPDRRPRRDGGDRAVLTYKAAWLKDEQEAGRRSVAEVKQAAAIAKLYTSEAAVTATRIATQVFGGNGFMEEYPMARFYRDAKILEIGEGTSEVQRMVIAATSACPRAQDGR